MSRANFPAFLKRSVRAGEEILIFLSWGLHTVMSRVWFPVDGARGSQPTLSPHHSKTPMGITRWRGLAKPTDAQRGERAAAVVGVTPLQALRCLSRSWEEIWMWEIWGLCLQPGTRPLL